jgi:hypothetical protein
MTNAPDSFNLDVRIRERLLKKRVITQPTVDSHLAGLKDAESDSVTLELEQPALAKPPVVVVPAVQPVQPVRSSVADLPPPPPGLIKESPTPPYTPMVIDLPRESSVNGVQLGASGSQASVAGATEGEAESDDTESDDAQSDDTESDDVQSDDADNLNEAGGADEAAAANESAEPKATESVDDEWGG